MKTSRTTPKYVIDKMWLIVQNFVVESTTKRPLQLLEPSAGEGDLLNHQFNNKYDVCAVELNKEKFEVLKSKFTNSIHGDFMKLDFHQNFDVIIAAPPFNNNVDVEHIQKMYSLLAKDGIIVTLTTPYWMTNNEPRQVQFREWLKDKDHKFEMLPDMTFVEKGKTVPTGILILKK